MNVGRTEGYIILLDEELLAAKGMIVKPDKVVPDKKEISAKLARQTRDRFDLRAAIDVQQRELYAEFKDENSDLEKAVAHTKTAVLKTLALQKGGGNSENYFWGDEPPMQITQGLTVMPDWFVAKDAISLHLSDWDIDELDVDVDVDFARGPSLCKLMRHFGYGSGLEKNKDLLTEIRTKKALNEILASASKPVVTSEDGGEILNDTSLPEQLRSDILGKIASQVSSIPSVQKSDLELSSQASSTNDLNRTKEIVSSLEHSGGPDNVATWYDYNVLNLAFESVWTSTFDKNFEETASQLFRETVKVMPDDPFGRIQMESIHAHNELVKVLNGIAGDPEADNAIRAVPVLPREVLEYLPRMDPYTWSSFSDSKQVEIVNIFRDYERQRDDPSIPNQDKLRMDDAVEQAENAVRQLWSPDSAGGALTYVVPSKPQNNLARLALQMQSQLNEPYVFNYFVPGSVNFGLMETTRTNFYSMGMEPTRCVSTFPLAPGETFEFSYKSETTQSLNEKRLEKTLRETNFENQKTTKSEVTAMAKVTQALELQAGGDGGLNFGIVNINAQASAKNNSAQERQKTNKRILEGVSKVEKKLHNETHISFDTTSNFEEEVSTKRTISNPNNELTVTYILYELERRYRVSTNMQRAEPVIAVALDMPAPHEINEIFIMRYSSIFRDVLLSSDFEGALDFVEDGLSADLARIEIAKATHEKQSRLYDTSEASALELAQMVKSHRERVTSYSNHAIDAEEREDTAGDIFGAIMSGGLTELFGDDNDGKSPEYYQAKADNAEKALNYLTSEYEAKVRHMRSAEDGLNQASKALSDLMVEKSRKDILIAQFILHLKDNIFHYMHEIWKREHKDKRFFSLYDMEVPFFPASDTNYRLRRPQPGDKFQAPIPGLRRDANPYVLEFDAPTPPSDQSDVPRRKLADIADLDSPLGFRGNFAIFPLRECCLITDVMLHSYFDEYFGTKDPATNRSYTAKDLIAYAKEAWNFKYSSATSPDADPTPFLSEIEKQELAQLIERLSLTNPGGEIETLFHTGQVYLDALVGENTLLEPFKRAHREHDQNKVQEEVRKARLENLRFAARLAQDQPLLDDPDVDKRTEIIGNPQQILNGE